MRAVRRRDFMPSARIFLARRSLVNTPMQCEAGIKDGDGAVFGGDIVGVEYGIALGQGDCVGIGGQAIEGGTVEGCERLELVKGGFFFEHMRQN